MRVHGTRLCEPSRKRATAAASRASRRKCELWSCSRTAGCVWRQAAGARPGSAPPTQDHVRAPGSCRRCTFTGVAGVTIRYAGNNFPCERADN